MHRTTVALALRDSPKLPHTTRLRLQKIAHELGYRPDPVLGALNAYRAGRVEAGYRETIAYIEHHSDRADSCSLHFELMREGATATASALGYRLERFWLDAGGHTPKQIRRVLIARGIRGLLLASFAPDIERLDFDWNQFCAVRIGHHPPSPRVPSVANNLFQITRSAVTELNRIGHRRIGLATSVEDTEKQILLMHAGLDAGLRSCPRQIPVSPAVFPARHRDGRGGIIRRLASWARRSKPDVLISNWNFPPAELKQIASESGQTHLPFFSLDAPVQRLEIAGIIQNHRLVGAAAVDQLDLRLKSGKYGEDSFPTLTLIDGYLRDSAAIKAPA